MVNIRRCIVIFLTLVVSTPLMAFAAKTVSSADGFIYKITSLPPDIQTLAKKYIWHPQCPVPLTDFAYVTLTYWGMDHKKHLGYLIVNKKIAAEVVDIFREIYEIRFPIERMEPIPYNLEVSTNDTSALYCRAIRGKPNTYSLHSYGYAIDINPTLNPSITGKVVASQGGESYLDRRKPVPGMIMKGDKIYQIFINHGWSWGGNFNAPKDFMHFEKQPPALYHLTPHEGGHL